MKRWARANHQPNLPLENGRYVTACKEHVLLSKEAATEGMVLLKNEKNKLPLQSGAKVALFGKGTFDYVKGGGGSGDVHSSYVRNLYEGLKELKEVEIFEPLAEYYRENVKKQYAIGAVPGMTVEPAITEQQVQDARAFADTAIVVISRFSGEGWDRSSIECDEEYNPWMSEPGTSMPAISGRIFPKGDFYLTKEEEDMIARVEEAFMDIVVVLNIGGMMDTSWIKKDEKLAAALIAWQGGMEGGLATAEILMGKVSPSGKLSDTLAASVEDYLSTENFHESFDYVDYMDDIYVGYRYFETFAGAKDKVCYPFGYGLSYTSFVLENIKTWEEAEAIKVSLKVTNTGTFAGKEVLQVYTSAPQGLLQKPAKELKAFAKTKLLQPGEAQELELSFIKASMASYDDLGKVAKSAYVLEAGEYGIYVGTNVRDVVKADWTYQVKENQVVEQLSAKLVPTQLKKRILADGTYEELPLGEPNDPNVCIFEKMVPGMDEGILPAVRGRASCFMLDAYKKGTHFLIEVAEGKVTLDEFVEQLSDEDLIHLLGGQTNMGVANTFGIGNLPEYGVPNIMTADGPAGVRINEGFDIYTTAWPCATLLACTWNEALVEKVGIAGSKELKENNLSVWLTPAMNIHRNPLCGRNFEYYSEDPLLTGKMGAAMVRGIQSQNMAATIKHFAANNKETNRKHSDSRVSERALREIYLKGFEIAVKEGGTWAIMSSYNMINGHRTSECRELLEDILRGEWGYEGLVMTDWWNRAEQYKEIKAGNDLKMANGYPERVKKAMEMGALTREELLISVKRVLGLILKIE
ncbi:MAG: glycoside hydrolase family 3 C-terminal domain-containing protein [Lachnospiraceae bacterium]|nr:glycoside hydrolase family 3 C-terminal domain-containing protein [Lachnospiraceae bacterium]